MLILKGVQEYWVPPSLLKLRSATLTIHHRCLKQPITQTLPNQHSLFGIQQMNHSPSTHEFYKSCLLLFFFIQTGGKYKSIQQKVLVLESDWLRSADICITAQGLFTTCITPLVSARSRQFFLRTC